MAWTRKPPVFALLEGLLRLDQETRRLALLERLKAARVPLPVPRPPPETLSFEAEVARLVKKGG